MLITTIVCDDCGREGAQLKRMLTSYELETIDRTNGLEGWSVNGFRSDYEGPSPTSLPACCPKCLRERRADLRARDKVGAQ